MKKRLPVIFMAFILLMLGSNFASYSFGETIIFGPTYVRGTGKPQKVTQTFSVQNINQEFTLNVRNGLDKAGRVSSAVIAINGSQVVGPSDFNKQVEVITKPVFLQQNNNEITFELRSQPGAYIEVTIVGAGGNSAPPSNLPPDPGENGKLTLEGIDSDADGVRDDVQRYIALTYPDSVEIQRALRQHVKAVQIFMIQADSKEQSLNNATKIDRSIECVFAMSPNDDYAIKAIRSLRSVIVNTEKRTRAYLSADKKLSGGIFPSVKIEDRIKSCTQE